MTKEELTQAAKVFHRIAQMKSYVSKERFVMVANTRFGIDDERKLDVMYGMLNMSPKLIAYIAIADDEAAQQTVRIPDYIKLIPKAIEIAESAYELRPAEWGGDYLPTVKHEQYRKEDKRRYYYTDGKKAKTIDIRMHSRADIILLSELLQRDSVELQGVANHLGYLEGDVNGNSRERVQYFDGDIFFLHPNPTDRVFYDWYSRGDEAGVYVATDEGWRKLLYTPGRGYIDKDGDAQYVDDKHYYSDHKLEQSGMRFHYVGNIHYDMAVLREKKTKKKKD